MPWGNEYLLNTGGEYLMNAMGKRLLAEREREREREREIERLHGENVNTLADFEKKSLSPISIMNACIFALMFFTALSA